MYNVVNNVSEPEQTFACTRNSNEDNQKKRKAVSFCFGKPSEAWGSFVIYILTNFGEIYAMCPIVPDKWYEYTIGIRLLFYYFNYLSYFKFISLYIY